MFSFTKARRLLEKSDYSLVFQQGKRISMPNFLFLFRWNNLGYARLGLAIAKKSVPKSCERNRIKRQLRESFRLHELPAVDLVVLAKPGLSRVDRELFKNQLGKAWDKLAAQRGG